jgi:cytochrome c5
MLRVSTLKKSAPSLRESEKMKLGVSKVLKGSLLGVCLLASVTLSTLSYSVEDKYQKACAVCHAASVAGAPKSFDPDAWAPRLKLGIETLVASVKNGKGAMPPKGLCMDCSDEDYAALIEYMSKARQ